MGTLLTCEIGKDKPIGNLSEFASIRVVEVKGSTVLFELKTKRGAAAPELLEALENAQSTLRLFYDSAEDNKANPTMQSQGRQLKQIGKLIAKAKGEA